MQPGWGLVLRFTPQCTDCMLYRLLGASQMMSCKAVELSQSETEVCCVCSACVPLDNVACTPQHACCRFAGALQSGRCCPPPNLGVDLYVLHALPADSVGPFEVVDVVTATMEYLTSWKELQQEVKPQQPSLGRRRLAATVSDRASQGYILDRSA